MRGGDRCFVFMSSINITDVAHHGVVAVSAVIVRRKTKVLVELLESCGDCRGIISRSTALTIGDAVTNA
jgi:hypothetical protein